MKTQKITTNKNLIATLLIAVTILLSGCNKSNLLAPDTQKQEISSSERTAVSSSPELLNYYYKAIDLMAGEHLYKVGTIEIFDKNNGTVEVKYTLNSSWKLHSLKLYLGSMNDLPIDLNGKCVPEMFPYKQLFPSGGNVTSSSILIAKTSIPRLGIISAYAKIINTVNLTAPEDAWALGKKISPTDVAMYSNYSLVYTVPPVVINPIKKI